MEAKTFVVSTKWDGKPRRLYPKMCAECLQIFHVPRCRFDQYAFCSRQCGIKHRHRAHTVELTCWQCGSKFRRAISKTVHASHNIHFCGRKCKDTAQKINGGCTEIRPSHYKDGHHSYRSTNHHRLASGCVDCGEKRDWLLQFHHIDGQRSNNHEDNIEVVCDNDHRKRHLRWNGEKWVRDNKALTPRNILKLLDSGPVAETA